MFRQQLTIAQKLTFSFVAILLLVALLVGVSTFALSTSSSRFSNLLEQEAGMIEHAGNARIALLEARRIEKELLYADDPTLVKAATGFMTTLQSELGTVNAMVAKTKDAKLLEAVPKLLKFSEDYQRQFQAMTAAAVGSERMVAALPVRKTAQGMESALKELMESINSRIGHETGETQKHVEDISNVALLLGLVVLLVGGLVTFFLPRAIARPLAQMRDVIAEVERTGDLSKRVGTNSKDEVGQTAVAFDRLIETQQKAIGEVNGVVSAIAAGDFSRRVEADLKGDLQTMKGAVNASAESVKVTMDGLNEVMKALYNGDFSQRMSTQVKGEFKLAIDQAMQAMLGDVGGVMAKVSDGDLSRRVTAEGRGDLARLKENINASLVSLSSVMKAVSQNTQQVAAASNQTSNAIGQISDGAQNQMHAINQVATAVQQTAAAVTEVAKSAESANTRAQGMGKAVNDGIADMNQMIEIVQAIATNADRIDKITDVIEKIANKTNLLSLNAAIEAARAGEHGKGFAVVAEEVGKLAASAGESTQEITALVKQAVEDADRATGTVAVVNKGMQEISNGARQTEAELQRISAAMEQQNAAISEINANVGSLNRIASANASAAEEITSTVIELARLADGTRREVEKFST